MVIALGGYSPGTSSFIFRWDGTNLTSIGKTNQTKSGVKPALDNVWLGNLYGDGTTTAASSEFMNDDSDAPTDPSVIYVLKNGTYVFGTNAIFLNSFYLSDGYPGPVTESFTVDAGSAGPYTLRIGNGNVDNSSRVTNATVTLNGIVVVSSGTLTGQIGTFSIPLSNIVAGTNTITVSLAGDNGSQIAIAIESHIPTS